MPAERVTLFMIDVKAQEPCSWWSSRREGVVCLPQAGDSLPVRALRRRTAVRLDDSGHGLEYEDCGPRVPWWPDPADEHRLADVRRPLALPVEYENSVVGVLEFVDGRSRDGFASAEVGHALFLARAMGEALVRRHRQQKKGA